MYFEDIYTIVRPLWKDEFSLLQIEETETYVNDIAKNWNEVEFDIEKNNRSTALWEGMLSFTMYQALTATAIKKWKEQKAKNLNFNEISKNTLEEYFRKNLYEEGNEEFLKKYKGMRQ